MRPAPVCVLTGLMGAGKTTVGMALAGRLGVDFRDTDHAVETWAGKAVRDVFAEHGERHFRALERDVIARELDTFDGVLALGGGAVLAAETRVRLAEHTVVLLSVGLAAAVARVGAGDERPLLAGGAEVMLRRLIEQRGPLYAAVATHVVVTDGRDPDDIAAEVAALVRPGSVSPAGHLPARYTTRGDTAV